MDRPLILAGVAAGALIALHSCSMQAAVTTDDNGRIVELSSLQIGSTLTGWVLEMLVVGGGIGVELRKTRSRPAEMRTQSDGCPAIDVSGLIASLA